MIRGDRQDGSFVVDPDLGGSALDAIVRALFGLSWGRARDLVRRGKVAIDGRVVTEPTARIAAGASVSLDLAARDARAAKTALPEGAIVHVDAHLVVVDKPAGIATVPFDPAGMGASIARRAQKGEAATLDERVRVALSRRERARGHGGAPPEIGVVHRLDKETSGLLVFTRTWAAKKVLLSAFRFHHVDRRYLAIVRGVPAEGTIVTHFVEDRGDGVRGSVEKRSGRKRPVGSEKTQRAVTHVEVVERLEGRLDGQPCALVACRLETGRTHQIRIHLAEAGHPLLGERVYVRGSGGRSGPALDAPRVMLHAAELGFEHPATQRAMHWTAPLPADMQETLARLRA